MIQNNAPCYDRFLQDESGFRGNCRAIAFPASSEEALETYREMLRAGEPVTVQGSLTGLVGAAVPQGGYVLNTSRMNRVLDYIPTEHGAVITVEPGMALSELRREISARSGRERLFWPPDPTSVTASVGGIVMNRSAGLTAFRYGGCGEHIEEIHVVDYRGNERGGTAMAAPGELITSISLILRPRPESLWGICFFLRDESAAGEFVEGMTRLRQTDREATVATLEYMDRTVLSKMAEQQPSSPLRELPSILRSAGGAVYTELHGSADEVESVLAQVLELSERCGCAEADTWAGSDEIETARIRSLRIAASETVHACAARDRSRYPSMTALTANMNFTGEDFGTVLKRFQAGAEEENLSCCIYGRADSSVYATLLPETEEQWQRGRALLRAWARDCRALGGRITGEFGTGKITEDLYEGILE